MSLTSVDYENAGIDVQRQGYDQLKSDCGKTTVERVAWAYGIRETTIQIVADSRSYEDFDNITRHKVIEPMEVQAGWSIKVKPNQQYSTGVYVASFITLLAGLGLFVWLLVTIINFIGGLL